MTEDALKAAVLGVIQGLTEFLPVSSTGHLVLAEKAMGVSQDRYGLSFDASLHLGTLLALLVFFGMTWVRLFFGGLRTMRERSFRDPEGRLGWLIVLGTIPAGVAGVLLESTIEDAFRAPLLVATMLIAFSVVFVIAEARGRQRRDTSQLGWADALIIGVAQAVALVPGVSRSGATICAGLLRDVERREAATFAFLLSAPVIAGAGLKQLVAVVRDFADGTYHGEDFVFFSTGFACSAIVGWFSIRFLLAYLTTNSLRAFVIYRVGLGVAVIAMVIVQTLA
ncbi:MAG: undecaprenyl-diphosphatase UppP [Dehalococcoidia bacterium]|nr:MAG: undecaprenyl-diphosphatase UppP [Dehalococcoidia bacterium]